MTNLPSARDGEWKPGERAVFHPLRGFYLRLGRRTGVEVEVMGRGVDGIDFTQTPTFKERAEDGVLAMYKIKFSDGRVDDAFEDELVERETVGLITDSEAMTELEQAWREASGDGFNGGDCVTLVGLLLHRSGRITRKERDE